MTKKKFNKSKFISAVIFVLLVALVFVFSRSFVSDYIGKGDSEKKVTVTIESGDTTRDVAKELKENGLIDHTFFFRLMSKVLGHDATYKEGTFYMTEDMGYDHIFRKLSGAPDAIGAVKITIPEGFEFRQIADILEENGLVDRERFYEVAQNHDFGYAFLNKLPYRENRLEGYLFPDTYIFDSTSTEESIIDAMLKRFDEIVIYDYEMRAKELDMTLDEIITLASVIEREAKGDSDRDKVSSVFHNRLKSETYPYLESCATVQYILKERKAVLSEADTEIRSPYNTYINPGLPIGPIASPGEASIKAALYPAETDYLFFVLDSKGNHHFSTTYEEHLENMNK